MCSKPLIDFQSRKAKKLYSKTASFNSFCEKIQERKVSQGIQSILASDHVKVLAIVPPILFRYLI